MENIKEEDKNQNSHFGLKFALANRRRRRREQEEEEEEEGEEEEDQNSGIFCLGIMGIWILKVWYGDELLLWSRVLWKGHTNP